MYEQAGSKRGTRCIDKREFHIVFDYQVGFDGIRHDY